MPLLLGLPLAVIGGAIGVFCTALIATLPHGDISFAVQLAAKAVVVPPILLAGVVQAVPGTVGLLPLSYYLLRSRIPVTPGAYTLVGAGLGLLVLLPMMQPALLLAGNLTDLRALESPMVYALIARAVATLTAASVCGALFGYLMRGHYARYRVSRNETS